MVVQQQSQSSAQCTRSNTLMQPIEFVVPAWRRA